MRLHYEMVSASLIQVLRDLMKLDVLMNFRLVGGTSLALQLGHCNSVDIDLFGEGNTPPSTPEIFLRDFSIQYVSGKSWESYCEWMKQAIVTFERDLESEKEAKLKERKEKIPQLIEQKRNKQK